MSKKQVILMSLVAALPAAGLVAALVMNGLEHGGQMFSGFMTVIIALTGILCLFGLVGLPFYVMAFYPAEGFAAIMPPVAPGVPAKGNSDSDDDEFEDEDDDDELKGFAGDDDEFEDDDDFESDDSFADDDDDFDADDWE